MQYHTYQHGGASAALQPSLLNAQAGLTRPASAEGMTASGSAVGTVEYCRAHCARIARVAIGYATCQAPGDPDR